MQANPSGIKPITERTLLAPRERVCRHQSCSRSCTRSLGIAWTEGHSFRPFNHTGPGQSEEFVIPAFAAQIARIEANAKSRLSSWKLGGRTGIF